MCPPETLAAVAAAVDWTSSWDRTLLTVLQHPVCPPDILAAAAQRAPASATRSVQEAATRRRLYVARNPNCPPDLLGHLAADPDKNVAKAAAANPTLNT